MLFRSDAVSRGLQQSKRPNPRRAPSILHVANDLPLQPNRVGNRRQQHDEHDHRLDHRHEYENANRQCLALQNAGILMLDNQSAATSAGLTS